MVYDADLLAIYQEKISEIPEIYELKGMQVISGSNLTPTATVRLSRGDEILEDSSIGDGPVDASYRAVDRLTGMSCKLIQYSLNAVTQGKDALGEVLVKIEHNGSFYAGHAASTDIVEASVKAYLYAVNRAVYDQKKEENDKVALDG